jgi:choline dehydrogenase-like flavoprotein
LRSQLSDPHQKIGVGLTDHPAFFSQIYELDPSSPFAGFENHAKVMMYHKQATSTDHPYNVELLINPKYWDVAHADDDVWKQQVGNDQRTMVSLQFVCASPLDDRNRVFHKGEGQKLGVKVHRNQSGSHLRDEVRNLRNRLLDFLQARHNPNDNNMHFGNEGTVHHAGGSMRMSDNHTGVVDEKLRMEAYNNLYVCDVSVFPMIPAANPSLTLAALALRLADQLSQLP